MLQQLLGNEPLKQGLLAALQAGRLSHSVLLCGETGCGAGFAARALAADYLYPQGGPPAEAVMQHRAPECIEVRGEGASGEIKIDRIRSVRRAVYDTALSAAGRVVILYGAQKLNQSSANALLKVLEEPPANVLFVLTASSAAAVLPTIRSRCAMHSVAPVSHGQCVDYLKKACPGCTNAPLLAKIYAGCIGKALAAATLPAAQKSLATALKLAADVSAGNGYEVLCTLSGYEKDKPGTAALLGDLSSVAAAVLEGETSLGLSPLAAAKIAARCTKSHQRLAQNANQKLLLTQLGAELMR